MISIPFQNIVEKTERGQWVQGEALLPYQTLSSFFHLFSQLSYALHISDSSLLPTMVSFCSTPFLSPFLQTEHICPVAHALPHTVHSSTLPCLFPDDSDDF